MNSCPARDRIERLLGNGLVDTELDAIERHVEGCADCQHTLDELTSRTVRGPEPRLESLVAVDPPHVTVDETASGDERKVRRLPTVAGYEILCELGRGGIARFTRRATSA